MLLLANLSIFLILPFLAYAQSTVYITASLRLPQAAINQIRASQKYTLDSVAEVAQAKKMKHAPKAAALELESLHLTLLTVKMASLHASLWENMVAMYSHTSQ